MLRICDRDLPDAGIEQRRKSTAQVELRRMGNPYHKFSARIFVDGAGFSKARGFKLLRITDVGRKKQIERRAILNLSEKIPRRTVCQPDLVPSLLFELCGNVLEREGQIRCRSDIDFTGARDDWTRDANESREQENFQEVFVRHDTCHIA